MKPTSFFRIFPAAAAVLFCAYASGQPVIGGYNVYYGSLHDHTNVSDGSGTPAQAYDYAKNTAHLDFFGLADHSWMISSTEWATTKSAANTYNQDGVFAAFYGFEWTSYLSYGHAAVVQTEDYCGASGSTSSFSGLLTWLNQRTGIAFFNHPGWDGTAWSEFNHFTDPPCDKVVGMELWNDNDGFSTYYYNDGYYSNDGGKGYFDEALVRGWKIGAAGSDDNHDADWGTATPYRVGVLSGTLSRDAILNAFRARRFFATLDKNISLSFKINGAEMGSTIPGGTGNMTIEANDQNVEVFTQIILVKNGAVIQTWNIANTNPFVSQTVTCNDKDYFYVRVKQVDGGEAISSPIFISGSANMPPVVLLTAPANNAVFTEGTPILLSATASDGDGQVARVEFYQGSILLGTDFAAPYEITWTGAPAKSYVLTAKAFDNLGASATSAPVSITVQAAISGVVNAMITSGNDDAEEYAKGTVILNSDDIDMAYDSKTSGNQTVGLLFRNLKIPAGSTIKKAYIQFTADKRTTNVCSLTIKGEFSSAATDFRNINLNLSGRTKTSSSVPWLPPVWKVVGSRGAGEQTPDIRAIVQEIVGQSDWTTSSNMVILITGSGTRTAESYDGLPANAASLHVEYDAPAGETGQAMEISPELTAESPEINQEPELKNASISHSPTLAPVGLVVYPNPVTGKMTVRVTGESAMEKIRVWSVSGLLVMEREGSDVMQETELDCGTLVPGVYLLSVRTGRGNLTTRFVKQ